jgi:hypothetical protein
LIPTFLIDADDDWQEGFRSYAYPRLHPYLKPFGGYGVGTVGYNQYVGTVSIDEEVLEEEFVDLGFYRNPIACFKNLPDGRESEGSWALRSRHDQNSRLDPGRQLHVTLFEREDGEPGRELYAHEEYDWQVYPIRHLREVDFDPEAGSAYARELIDTRTFAVLDTR